MRFVRRCVSIRAAIVLALILGIAAPATAARKRPTGPNYEQLMQSAEAEVGAGRLETALANFNSAAMADPTRKEPWVRSAQLQFDAGNYGRAIVAAEEVLKRDPNDLVADSVLTVGGLRVASASLVRLQGRGAIASDTARREAEQLRATMVATMGTEFVTGERAATPKPKARSAAKPRARAPVAASAGSAPLTPVVPVAAPAAATAPGPRASSTRSAPAAARSSSNPFD